MSRILSRIAVSMLLCLSLGAISGCAAFMDGYHAGRSMARGQISDSEGADLALGVGQVLGRQPK